MANTQMLSSNSLAQKKWELETTVQLMQYTAYGLLNEKGAIYHPTEIGRGKIGDQVTFAFAGKLTKAPIGEGGTAYNNAEALDLASHSMAMNVSRVPVHTPNTDTIEQARTSVDFDSVTMTSIKNRTKELLDTSILYQLAGAAPSSLTINGTTYSSASELLHVQGHNTPVAPSSERVIRAGGAANDQSLTTANTFRLDLIDAALEAAALSNQPIEMFDDGTFVLIVSPEQATDLIRDSAGKSTWYSNQMAMMAGGRDGQLADRYGASGMGKSMIYLGLYGNVHIFQAPRVAYGVNSSTSAVITTVRRAVLVGKNALSFATLFGKSLNDGTIVKYFEQEVDLQYSVIREGRMIYGAKKMIPGNKQDTGVIVISSYAAAHSA